MGTRVKGITENGVALENYTFYQDVSYFRRLTLMSRNSTFVPGASSG